MEKRAQTITASGFIYIYICMYLYMEADQNGERCHCRHGSPFERHASV